MIVSLPSCHISHLEHKLVEQLQCILQGVGVGYNPWLVLSMRKRLIQCIHKGGGHTRYKLQYIDL